MASILEICQDAAALAATQKPQNLFDSSSLHEAIFLSIAKSTLESLRRYGDWQELIKEGVLKTHENKKTYYIRDFCPDFFSLVHNTVFVKDKNEKVVGALNPAEYMRDKYFNIKGIGVRFKIQNGRFVFLEQPDEGLKIVFNYRSENVCYDPEAEFCEQAEKNQITKNTDVPLFDDYLVKLGILWRWYKRNGLPYEEEFNEYESEVKKCFASGLALRDIALDGEFNRQFSEEVIVYAQKDN